MHLPLVTLDGPHEETQEEAVFVVRSEGRRSRNATRRHVVDAF